MAGTRGAVTRTHGACFTRGVLLATLLMLLAPLALRAQEPEAANPSAPAAAASEKLDPASLTADAILALTPADWAGLTREDFDILRKTLDQELKAAAERRRLLRSDVMEKRLAMQKTDPQIKDLQAQVLELRKQMEAIIDANPDVKALNDEHLQLAERMTTLGMKRMDLIKAQAGVKAAAPGVIGSEGVQP